MMRWNKGGPIFCAPCAGIVVARPSGCCHRSWLPVCRVLRNPSFSATRRNSSARALGMDDSCGVGWQVLVALCVLLGDDLEDSLKFL
jgi:hypothetical protein